MRSFMKSTIRAGMATQLVFAAVLLMGLAPLCAGGVKGLSGKSGAGTTAPSGGGGVVNVPSMPEQRDPSQDGQFDPNTCGVIVELTPGTDGVSLIMPAGTPQVIATYQFQETVVTTSVQEGVLNFATASLELMRAAGVESFDLSLVVSQSQYLRARVELPADSNKVTVRIE